MIDFPAQPAMALNLAQRAVPEKAPAVTPVQNSVAAGQTALRNDGGRGQQPPTEFQRHMAQFRHNDRLIGPPPSFQANVLDVENDIKRSIERLEENREKTRNRDAAAPARLPEHSEPVEEPVQTREPAADSQAEDAPPAFDQESSRLA